MPINPNIALGAQQQQPVNMLGQMGQAMAIKAAQQEMEGNEDVRNAFARGAPEDPTQLLQYGKQGRAAYESLIKGRTEQLNSAEKRLIMTGQIAGYVRDNPTPENFVSAVGTMVQNGVLTRAQADRVIADAGNDPIKIKSYATQAASSAVTEADKMRDKTSRDTNAATVGASYYSTNTAAQTAANRLDFDRNRRNVIAGDNRYNTTDPYGNIYPVESYGAVRGPNAPAAGPAASVGSGGGAPALSPAAANAFVTARPSVNNLVTQPSVVQPGSPTVANAAAIAAQENIPRPPQTIRQPVAVIKDGVVTLVPPEQAVGMTPATPGAEKALEKTAIAAEGKKSVSGVLNTLYSEYSNLVKSSGITDTRKSMEDNIAARTGASGVGQLTGSFTGSESQSFRDTIEQTRPLLLTAIMKATGLSATQLNSNVELQTYLKTATDTKVSIQSNVKALNNISTMFGLGEKFEVPEIKTSKSANIADAPPPGLSPEIAKLWQYMPAEDRKLWQK